MHTLPLVGTIAAQSNEIVSNLNKRIDQISPRNYSRGRMNSAACIENSNHYLFFLLQKV